MRNDFSGLSVALATPFLENGEVDIEAYRRLIRHVVAGGIDTLVTLGSTGEAATIDEDERDAVISTCLDESAGKPVVVGCGHNCTATAVRLTRRAEELGAAGVLIVTPYYNKPTTNGIVAHYQAIADAAPTLPIIAYNVPGRTGLNLTPTALARLWEIPQVVAVKESSGNLVQIGEIARTLPAGKQLLSGDDNLAVASIAVGASGLVSVIANLLPAQTKALVDAARAGRLAEAQGLQRRLLPLMDALFIESNPIPLKAGLGILGIAGDTLRLPLTRPLPSTAALMRDALSQAAAEAL